ncbi:MAG: serine hydrolase [Pseudomonadota bacterium]
MNKSVRATFYALLLLAGLVLLLAGCQPAGDSSAPMSDAQPGSSAADSELQDWIDKAVNDGDSLAISAMLLDGDSVSYYSGGAISPDGAAPNENTQYQIGSITKVFTNMLLAEMVADGKLGYDTALGDLMGEDFTFANADLGKVTMEQLATHTSGLARMPSNFAPTDPQDPYKDYTAEQLNAEIAQARNKQVLVAEYGYSNLGMGLLGYRLGQLEGSSYTEEVIAQVVAPLGLEETGFERSDNLADGYRSGSVVPAWLLPEPIAAAGALWGSTSDFVRLAQVMLGQAESPLKHDIEAVRDSIAQAGPDFDVTRVWHMTWADDQPIYWHNGGTGGYLTFFGFRPDTNQAVAILVAGGDGPTEKGLTMLGSTKQGRPAPEIDESVMGQYEIAPGVGIGVFERSGYLVGQVSGQAAARLYDGGNDWYSLNIADASLHFLREDGVVSGVELVQAGVVNPGARVADEATSNERAEVDIAKDTLSDYVGDFAMNVAVKFSIREGGDGLTAQLTGQQAFPIYYKGDDVFFYKVVDAELHFERDDSGRVSALTLHQGAIVQRAERIE